jgi:hypothetical protein
VIKISLSPSLYDHQFNSYWKTQQCDNVVLQGILGFLNIMHVVEIIKQNYSAISKILLEKSKVV